MDGPLHNSSERMQQFSAHTIVLHFTTGKIDATLYRFGKIHVCVLTASTASLTSTAAQPTAVPVAVPVVMIVIVATVTTSKIGIWI